MRCLILAMVVVLTLSLIGGCQKERESVPNGRLLAFSSDTIAFDTLFTSI